MPDSWGGAHIQQHYHGQEHAVRQVTEPREEPATIILLNGHSIKLTHNDLFLHPKINVSLSPHQKSFFLYKMVVITESYNLSKRKE